MRQMLHLGCGLQISLPRNERAITISFQIDFEMVCISCFSSFKPSLVLTVRSILGAIWMTCKSAMMPTGGRPVSRKMTLADFLPIPLTAINPFIVRGMFSSFWIVSASSTTKLPCCWSSLRYWYKVIVYQFWWKLNFPCYEIHQK